MSSVQSIYINKTEMYMQVDTYDVLHVHTLPVDAEDNEIEWEIEDTTVVSLNNNIGQLRALRVGESSITIYLKSDHNIFAKCMVHVVERIPVESISFPVPELTMNVNNTMKLGVIVSPTNATNRKVYWSSCCPDIATVDSEGVVRPKSPGQVDIYATTEDRNLTAKCTITINEYILVRSIRFANSELTLKKSQTKKLTAIVEPSNATYPQVIWHSCCPDVATVDSSGKITPHSLGSVDIYATTVDGNFTAKCTVRVVIEDVTIKKVDNFNEVIFESGKRWKCIGKDLVFNETNRTPVAIARANYNLLATTESGELTGEYKTYSPEELKLLFVIDPHGVARYVETYAYATHKFSLKDRVSLKDYFFRILFNRDPIYFRRKNIEEWTQTTDTDNINEVLSESEMLFNMHKIHDDITEDLWDELSIKLAFLAAEIVFEIITSCAITPAKQLSAAILYETVETALKTYVLIRTGINTIDLIDSLGDVLGSYTFENTNLEWINDLTSIYGNISTIIKTFNTTPSYIKHIANHCVEEICYNVKIKLANGSTHTMSEIYNCLT